MSVAETIQAAAKPRAAFSVAAILVLLAGNVQAAQLSNVEGAVSVNQGNGFQPAAIGAEVGAGDRIRAVDGTADIVYPNGCSTRVGPHQVAVVLADAPGCTPGGGLKDGVVAAPVEEYPLLIGGLLAGTAAGLVVAISSSSSPTSP